VAARSVVSPAVDALCVGGASLAACLFFLPLDPASVGPRLAALSFLSAVLNWPHFMASYHLLYTTPGAARKHPFAALWVPAALVVYAAAAAAFYDREPLLFHAFHAAAAIYLARHYTGQAWGMMAAFAHVEGVKVSPEARRLLTGNMSVLLAWHAVWAVHGVAAKLGFERFRHLYELAGLAALGACAVGALGLKRLRDENGRLPLRVLLPWLAIHSWYALIYRHPKALFLVQLGHALQYLIFPLRVEANRRGGEPASPRGALYYALLAVSGLLLFGLLPRAAAHAAAWGALTVPAAVLVVDLLNIHHYFVDGCIWKLRNPEVRRDLFLHLEKS
jgi:hypothetical protein